MIIKVKSSRRLNDLSMCGIISNDMLSSGVTFPRLSASSDIRCRYWFSVRVFCRKLSNFEEILFCRVSLDYEGNLFYTYPRMREFAPSMYVVRIHNIRTIYFHLLTMTG